MGSPNDQTKVEVSIYSYIFHLKCNVVCKWSARLYSIWRLVIQPVTGLVGRGYGQDISCC